MPVQTFSKPIISEQAAPVGWGPHRSASLKMKEKREKFPALHSVIRGIVKSAVAFFFGRAPGYGLPRWCFGLV